MKPKTVGAFIIGSAIIWAAVIMGCAAALNGTECYAKIQMILVGGVLTHIILIWGPAAILFRGLKSDRTQEK